MRVDVRPSQWLVAAVLIGWVVLAGWALPRVAASVPADEAVAAGQPVSAGGVAMTPVEGWAVPKDVAGILILRKQGTQITAFPPQPASGDATNLVEAKSGTLKEDASTDWQINDPVSFTSAGGSEGAYVVALAPQQFIASFAVVDGDQAYTVDVSGTDTDWTTLHDEIVDIVKTLQPAGGAS